MVTIKTSFTQDELPVIAEQIFNTTRTVPTLTPRPLGRLKSLMSRGGVAIAMDGDNPVGWLVAAPYSKNIQEIGMAYVDPGYRRQAILEQLLGVTIDQQVTTIAVVYDDWLAQLLIEHYQFGRSSLRQFVLATHGKFVLSRATNLRAAVAVVSHVRRRQPIYLLRGNAE